MIPILFKTESVEGDRKKSILFQIFFHCTSPGHLGRLYLSIYFGVNLGPCGRSDIRHLDAWIDPWFLICTWAPGPSFLPYLPYWVFTKENGCETLENHIRQYELLLLLPKCQHFILPAIQQQSSIE